jgi:hypothetical protein
MPHQRLRLCYYFQYKENAMKGPRKRAKRKSSSHLLLGRNLASLWQVGVKWWSSEGNRTRLLGAFDFIGKTNSSMELSFVIEQQHSRFRVGRHIVKCLRKW